LLKNKEIVKSFSKQNSFLLLFSLLFVSLFLAYFVYSSPSPTIIGEDISTNNLLVSGNSTTTNLFVQNLAKVKELIVSGTTTFNGVSYLWPSTAGSNGQVLTTDGSGHLSWSDVSAGISGSGSSNFLAKWIDSDSLSTSTLYESNGKIGIGLTTPEYTLDVSGSIRASKSLTAGINVESLTGNKTLTPGEDAMYQYLDPNGVNRTIYLATSTAKAGDRFVIRNNGAYNSSYYLFIKQGETELDKIYAGAIKEFIFDGTNWISASNGSGENDNKKYNVAIGAFSSAFDYGVAVGYSASGDFSGVGVGYNAVAGSLSVGVGYNAAASLRGVAVGADALAEDFGTAVGYNADGHGSGVAVGYSADGESGGAAVGASADARGGGVAVGRQAKGMGYGTALGFKAGYKLDTTVDRYNILIGAYSGYRLTYGTSNIIIGYRAGYDETYSPTTGSNNILIGTKAWTPTTSTSDFLNIGGLIFGTGLSREPNSLATGNVGIGVTNPNYKLQVAGDIAPSSDNAYDLGKSTLRWAHLYAASTTVGDLIFNNNFRIVETQPEEEIQGIVIKNQKNETIATFKENGELKLEGGISLGNENSPTGITLYDKITKKPYCLEIANGEIVIREGECQR